MNAGASMNTPKGRLRVALADDHPVVLAGIAALLGSAPDL